MRKSGVLQDISCLADAACYANKRKDCVLLELLHVSMSVGVITGSVAYATVPKHASSNSRRIMAAMQQMLLFT